MGRERLSGDIADLNPVLLVEDDPIVTQVVSDVLGEFDIEVVVAQEIETAVNICKQLKNTLFCAIVDYSLLGKSPEKTLSSLSSASKHLNIVVSSGYPRAHIMKNLKTEHVHSYLGKPYSPVCLIKALEELLEPRLAA